MRGGNNIRVEPKYPEVKISKISVKHWVVLSQSFPFLCFGKLHGSQQIFIFVATHMPEKNKSVTFSNFLPEGIQMQENFDKLPAITVAREQEDKETKKRQKRDEKRHLGRNKLHCICSSEH